MVGEARCSRGRRRPGPAERGHPHRLRPLFSCRRRPVRTGDPGPATSPSSQDHLWRRRVGADPRAPRRAFGVTGGPRMIAPVPATGAGEYRRDELHNAGRPQSASARSLSTAVLSVAQASGPSQACATSSAPATRSRLADRHSRSPVPSTSTAAMGRLLRMRSDKTTRGADAGRVTRQRAGRAGRGASAARQRVTVTVVVSGLLLSPW